MIRFEIYGKDATGFDRVMAEGVKFNSERVAVQWRGEIEIMVYKDVGLMMDLHAKPGYRIEWLDTLPLASPDLQNRNQLRQSAESSDEDEA